MKQIRITNSESHRFVLSAKAMGGLRYFYEPSRIILENGDEIASGCVGCAKPACISFTEEELSRTANIESGFSPELAVCPTNAIVQNDSRIPSVDESACIGCGICVTRCPFGAISMRLESGIAVVNLPRHADYVESNEMSEEEVAEIQQKVMGFLPAIAVADADGDISGQFSKFVESGSQLSKQAQMRLFARNSLLLAGMPSRLKITGDSNAWIDLVSVISNQTLIIEIEHGIDTLDAVRRLISGAAISIGRHQLDIDSVVGAIVFPKLPNSRVDFYRLLRDIKNRIGLTVVPIPVAVLLLAVRGGGYPLQSYLEASISSEDDCSVAYLCQELFQDFGPTTVLGLEPPK